jgi:ABC-type antimicrobial peptide transport system permease subunit
MEQVVSLTEAPRRFNTAVVTTFAGIALLLAFLGIYGVLAYSVSERTREIAVRMALGATRSAVLSGVLKRAFIFIAAGALAGLAACFGVTRLLRTLLYGVHPLDAISYLAAITVLLACALLAGSIPARRATFIDPMRALREE